MSTEHGVEIDPNCQYCLKPQSSPWDFVGQCIVIVLQDREDRRQSSEKELHRLGLCTITRFLRPIRHPNGFEEGCHTSHQEAAALALRHWNDKPVMILEDDARLIRHFEVDDAAARVRSALDKLPSSKWNRLSLGHYAWFSMFYRPGVLRGSTLDAHAQLWSKRGLEWMSQAAYRKGFGVDQLISLKLKFNYAITPMVFSQDQSVGSDSPDRKNGYIWNEERYMEASAIWIPIAWAAATALIALICIVSIHYLTQWSRVKVTLGVGVVFGLAYGILFTLILTSTV